MFGRKRTNQGITLAIVLSGIACGAQYPASGAEDTALPPKDDWPLAFSENVIKDTQNINPVASYLRGGVKFSAASEEKLETLKPDNVWFKIPPWLAGTWHYYEEKTSSYTDLRTGETKRDLVTHNQATVVWGWQKDKQGDVWEFEDSPHTDKAHSDTATDYYVRHKNQQVSLSPTKLTCIQNYTYFGVDNETHDVTKTFQSSTIVSFSRTANGIRRDVSAKVYDEDGKPVSISNAYSLAKKVKPFHTIDARAGKDVRPLFREYLTTHGLANLVPETR